VLPDMLLDEDDVELETAAAAVYVSQPNDLFTALQCAGHVLVF